MEDLLSGGSFTFLGNRAILYNPLQLASCSNRADELEILVHYYSGRGDRELSIDNTSQRYDCLSPGWCCGGEKGWHTPFTTNLTMDQGPANMLLGHDLTALLLELSDCYAHWMALYEALVWL